MQLLNFNQKASSTIFTQNASMLTVHSAFSTLDHVLSKSQC